jgi:hypothetical protein
MTIPREHLIRNLKKAGPACLAILCIGIMLTAGCIGTGTARVTAVAPPVVTPAAVPVSSGRALPASLALDPIVGTWRSPGPAYQFRIVFGPDGTTQETFANQPGVMYNGMWQSVGGNLYLVTRESGDKTVWVYSPLSNTLAKQSAPGITYSLYQGTTGGPAAALSGNGSMVVPFTATGTGLWTFTLNYAGGSNYIVWLTDSMGSRIALLANKIGTSSVTLTRQLSEGKYYLDVTAGGPWTVQATISA